LRIALIIAGSSSDRALTPIAEEFASGMESMGHRVDVLDARTHEPRSLPGYEYIAVLSEPISPFSGKIPESVAKFLAQAGSLVGKKGAAFLRSSGLFSGKAMAAVMRAMEKEGMWVNWSETVANPAQAAAVAKRVGS